MAKYKVLEKCFINNQLHEEGDIVEYNGKLENGRGQKCKHLEPVSGAKGVAAKDKDAKSKEEQADA